MTGVPELPSIVVDAVSAPYWNSLREGTFTYQRCRCCEHAWLPAREECPRCLATDVLWEKASGEAVLVSWVVYHEAFHDAFKNRLPYIVAVVELLEGPRLISNLVGSTNRETLRAGQALRLRIERDGEVFVPRFEAIPVVERQEDSMNGGGAVTLHLRASG